MLMPIPASIGRSMGVPAFAPHLLNAPVICRTGERLAAGSAEVGALLVPAGPFENPARPVGSAFGAYRPNTGFIRSLLMGSWPFRSEGCNADIRVAARLGSMTSAICGYLVVRSALPRASHI
jgi:hypothetical protein